MIWRCGHPRTDQNTIRRDGARCLSCRRALERRASRRYRQKLVERDQ